MKSLFTAIIATILTATVASAQNNIGINNANPAASAALMVDTPAAGPQGMLVPRMTQARRNAIAGPATGLMIYQTDNTPGFYYFSGSAWMAVGGAASGAKLDLLATKTAAAQVLPVSTGTADVEIYENVITAPTTGTYSTATNAYTVGPGAAGLYLIQTRNSMVLNGTASNTVGAYNWLEVNSSALGSYSNYYPTYSSSGSPQSVQPAAQKSPTLYTFVVFLNAGDVIRIRATGLNSASVQTLSNDGGCQLMIVKM